MYFQFMFQFRELKYHSYKWFKGRSRQKKNECFEVFSIRSYVGEDGGDCVNR